MDRDVKNNRIIIIVAFVFMFILAGFLLKFYLDQKKENSALRIKLITVSSNKRVPTTWNQLTSKKTTTDTPATETKNPVSTPTTSPPATSPVNNSAVPLADKPLETLAGELNVAMRQVKALSPEDLDKNIQIADEIISREPASYSAYKAKLILLLVKEGKYSQEADDAEIANILETMAGFDVTTDTVARKEAALLSNANYQLLGLQDNMSTLSSERVQVEQQLEVLEPESEEWAVLKQQYDELLKREEAASLQLTQFENTVQTALDDEGYLNEDVVEIPFMRLLAKNEFDTVIENAESLIEQFPTSLTGYFYLIRALEYEGRQDEVPEIIRNSQLPPDAQASLQNRLDQTRGNNPKNFWERLNF